MKDEKTSRRERRRRRLRNQILAYLVMIIIVAMVLTEGLQGDVDAAFICRLSGLGELVVLLSETWLIK